MLKKDAEFEKAAGGTAADLRKFVGMVVAMFRRKGAPGDSEDWEQDAALAVIDGIRKRGVTLTAHGARTYHYRAASCAVGAGISRNISIVHFGEKKAHLARERQGWDRVAGFPEDKTGLHLADGRHVSDALTDRDRRRARLGLMQIIRGHVAAMPASDREILEPLLGIRAVEASERAEVVAASGKSRQAVNGAVIRLATKVRGDRRAVRARRMFLAA
jgi:hypothetical protein